MIRIIGVYELMGHGAKDDMREIAKRIGQQKLLWALLKQSLPWRIGTIKKSWYI